MDIDWYGGRSFRLREGGRVVLVDPAASASPGRADVVAFTGAEGSVATEAFRIVGPGEYEVGGVFVIGVAVSAEETVYSFHMGDLVVAHLGGAQGLLDETQREAVGAVDVLLLPVTGPPGVSPEQAVEMVNLLEPALVVPIYDDDAQPRLARFLKEMGMEPPEPVTTLEVSPARLPDEPQVRLILPRGG